ncbi:hypothetical protein SDC9_178345 [bioreactor metagenome]|uniref:Uncharacterized protein n=1 Tax=bioreactor metagenome TaxID=1076179 RepID=A0A645H3I1_9ZZZZ
MSVFMRFETEFNFLHVVEPDLQAKTENERLEPEESCIDTALDDDKLSENNSIDELADIS